MGKEGTFSVIGFAHDDQPLAANQLSQILALACELRTHFTRVVHPCEEHKRGPCLGAISSPDRGHEPAMMLAQVVVEEEPRNVSGIHQVLDDGQPAAGVSTLRPEAPGQCGEISSAEAGLSGTENWGFRSCRRRQREISACLFGPFPLP